MAIAFEGDDRVLILERDEWTGPYIVTENVGRTPEHLVLYNPKNGVYFEHYNDAPYNTRKVG